MVNGDMLCFCQVGGISKAFLYFSGESSVCYWWRWSEGSLKVVQVKSFACHAPQCAYCHYGLWFKNYDFIMKIQWDGVCKINIKPF